MAETTKQFGHFNVRILRKGEKYGLNDDLTRDGNEPLVEFYDLDYQDDYWPRGQFVSRYYLSTMLEHEPDTGLDLDSGVKAWYVDKETMDQVMDWIREETKNEVAI